MTKNVLALYKTGALALRRSLVPGIGAGRGARPRCNSQSTKKQKKLLTFRVQPTGRELLANRAGGARQQHAHITFSSSITESPPFFLHPRRHVGQSDEDSTSPLHRGWRTKERTGDSTGSKSANEIHRSAQRSTNLRLPTRAGNVSAKGGSVCTCIVSKQQYGGLLLFGCRASYAARRRSPLARAETIFCLGDYESLMIAK